MHRTKKWNEKARLKLYYDMTQGNTVQIKQQQIEKNINKNTKQHKYHLYHTG
jgi:hypothetical protein